MVAQEDKRSPQQQALDLSLQLALRQKGVSQATLLVSLHASRSRCRVATMCDTCDRGLLTPCSRRLSCDAYRPGWGQGFRLSASYVQVAVRCRPLLPHELDAQVKSITRVVDQKVRQSPMGQRAAGLPPPVWLGRCSLVEQAVCAPPQPNYQAEMT